MSKTYTYSIILLLLYSCNNTHRDQLDFDEYRKPIVSNNFKLDFLKVILEDTSQVKPKWYKDPYIFISNIEKKDDPTKIDTTLKFLNEVEYLSFHLRTEDTSFIKHQLNNKIVTEDLIDYGFKTVNWTNLVDYHFENTDLDTEYFVSKDSIETIENLLKENGILYLSSPVFNNKLNLAYIETSHGITGEHILFEKKNDKWITKLVISQWIK
ncbi:hypothetical protein [uncultured Psychroserpens sp.]|uniref:hypothetical protein n=1 Tax=uncultured Psychroserpens sp. TaxID=255436 RepID=UPI00262B168D|nr:hypothetical protein [uncultured Psychroserpens sp.]